MGHDGIKTALAASKGEKVEANVDTGANLITKENMNSPRSQELLNPKVKVLIDPLLIFSCHRKAETSLYPSGTHNGLNEALLSFPDEVTAYLGSLSTNNPSEDLCVIWIGANDFSAGINPFQTVSTIKEQIGRLSRAGVKNFVAITIPDISLTPQVKAQGTKVVFATKQFVFTANLDMEVELPRFAMQHQISIRVVEINAIFYPVVFEPALFGFTNSVDLAYVPLNGPLQVLYPDDYVFWDGFHPTTKVHAIAANFISKAIYAPLPFHRFSSLR